MNSFQNTLFYMRSGALIYNGPLDENIKIDERELMIQIKQRKALFARYFTDSQFPPPLHTVQHLKKT